MPRPDMVTVAGRLPGRRRDGGRHPATATAASRSFGEGIDDIVGIVYAKDLMRAERDGQGDAPVRDARCGPPSFVPETKRVAELLREMQAEQVPHGDRRRRVRRHRRPGHARGPHRGAGRRDRRRVRRRGAHGRAAARRRRAGRTRACRSTRSTSCSTPSCPRATGTRSAACCSTCSATSRPRARAVECDGAPAAGRAGAGPPHRPGAHHAALGRSRRDQETATA